MQNIHSISVHLGLPMKVPGNGRHICSAFVGSDLRVYYVVEGEKVDWVDATFIIVNLSLEDRIPDSFEFMGCISKQRWDNDNLMLFARM